MKQTKPAQAMELCSLSAVLGDYQAEGTNVAMPTRKRCLSPGDIFAVPLGGGVHALGRLAPQEGCAVFAGITFEALRLPDAWRTLPMITLEDLITTDPVEKGAWPVVGTVPWNAGEFRWQHYMVGSHVTCAEGPPDKFTDVSSETRVPEPGEWNWRPKLSIWNTEGVIHVLRRKLGVA